MYIKVKKQRIKLVEANTFWERLKGLKFVLGPLQYGVRFPNKRVSNTNFLFVKIDVVLTDKDDKILYIFEGVGTEKKIHRKKDVYNTYFLPIHSTRNLKVGDVLELVVEKDDEIRRQEILEKKRKFFKKKKKA